MSSAHQEMQLPKTTSLVLQHKQCHACLVSEMITDMSGLSGNSCIFFFDDDCLKKKRFGLVVERELLDLKFESDAFMPKGSIM